MELLAQILKLGHVMLAMLLVAGLVGRWIVLRRGAAATDVEEAHRLSELASPFERLVQASSIAVVPLGLLTAWAQGYPWLGLTTGWILASVALLVPMFVLVPAVFIPRGRRFEAAMAEARVSGTVTDELRAAWNDSAVGIARWYEIVGLAAIIVLMVTKPF